MAANSEQDPCSMYVTQSSVFATTRSRQMRPRSVAHRHEERPENEQQKLNLSSLIALRRSWITEISRLTHPSDRQ